MTTENGRGSRGLLKRGKSNSAVPPDLGGIRFKTPSRCLKLHIVPNPIYINCVLSYTYIPFHLKEALYGFSSAYPNCQLHYSVLWDHY